MDSGKRDGIRDLIATLREIGGRDAQVAAAQDGEFGTRMHGDTARSKRDYRERF